MSTDKLPGIKIVLYREDTNEVLRTVIIDVNDMKGILAYPQDGIGQSIVETLQENFNCIEQE